MSTFRLSSQDRTDLVTFLRDLVQTPSHSTQEEAVAERIIAELERLGFRNVRTDRIGNVIGWVGSDHGPLVMLNGHMDTVQVSDSTAWSRAPFGAEIEGDVLYGLGSCDMKGGLAAMIYGVKLLRDSGISLKGGVVVACVVQEEPCEGLGSRVLIEEEGIRPNWVVLGEPTDLDISRGQRGRLEMRLTTRGRSAHSACPDLGENAIYTTARLVFGSISSSAGSRNAVPDRCELIIDRRLTLGENETKALSEVQKVIAREGLDARVEVTDYQSTSYTGYACHVRECYPAWVLDEEHPLVLSTARAIRTQLKRRPRVGCWDFSTEGAYTAGVAGIPTVGFGPGDPRRAHTADEHVHLADVYAAAETYAQLAVELLTT
jgi:acetylornithine deacetylase/succinyl-diaminopimelate desuccinylase-like protein